jgi:hypothetical protein
MNTKEYSAKQVWILLSTIVITFSFLETSFSIASLDFWRDFLQTLFGNAIIAGFVLIVVGEAFGSSKNKD